MTFEECKGLVRNVYSHIREKEEIHLKDSKIRILFCIDTLGGGGAEKLLIDILKRFDYELLVLFEEGIYFADIPEEVSWFFPGSEKVKNRFYDIEIAFLEGLAVNILQKGGALQLKSLGFMQICVIIIGQSDIMKMMNMNIAFFKEWIKSFL